MRRKITTATKCVLATLVLLPFTAPFSGSAEAAIIPGWDSIGVSSTQIVYDSTFATPKRQKADIVHLGGNRFIVGWVGSDLCVRANLFDLDANYKQIGDPPPLGCLTGPRGTSDTGWIRAAVQSPPTGLLPCEERVNWLTYHAWDPFSGTYRVKVDRIRSLPCSPPQSGVTHEIVDIGAGRFSAVAMTIPTTTPPDRPPPPSALVIWASPAGNEIRGRFVSTTGTGNEMTLYAPPLQPGQYIATPDIHFNTISQRFIVGFAIGGNSTDQPCTYFNMLLAPDGSVTRAPLAWGVQCDNKARGPHHTSVAFDSDANFNPKGYYAWWYMGSQNKGIYIFDSMGNETPDRLLANEGTGDTFTRPLTSMPTHIQSTSYAAAVIGLSWVRHLRRSIAGPWQVVENYAQRSSWGQYYPIATRGIDSGTVVIIQNNYPVWEWFISVSDH